MPCSPIVFQHSCHACPFLARARNHRPFHSRYDFTAPNDWAVTAIPFKLYGERQVNHVKINWQPPKGIQSYKVYRNGQLIGETQGNTYDDYDLKTDQTYTYRVDAYREHQKAASSATQETRTFTYSGETALYDNRNGRHLRTHRTNRRDLKSARLTSPTVCTEPTRT